LNPFLNIVSISSDSQRIIRPVIQPLTGFTGRGLPDDVLY